ncbi:hypothetical protein V8E52_011816, partial [Russula decolorans]
WCYVEGDNTLFPVTASSTASIDSLKNTIKVAKNNFLQRFDASDLTLMKMPRQTDAGEYQLPPNGLKLNAMEEISDVWSEPPPKRHLHLYVTVPGEGKAFGERCVTALGQRDITDRQSDLPWLEEVHSKIWNREDLRRELFPNVTVTRADFTALQNRLKVLHSDRDSLNYDGNRPDILSVKLEFLRSLPSAEALSPRDADDNGDPEASNEDDLESLFPFTLRFLNLSTLALKNKVTNRLPLPLLRRQEYEHISELIRNKYQNNGGSVIVSGQPGTGKTAYLYLRIIENMIEGRPFLFQAIEGTVYHVAEKGVKVVQSWSSKETIVAFVDFDAGDYRPNWTLIRHSVQLVVASSPEGANHKWTKQLGHITRLAIKLWSSEELLRTGIFLHPCDLSFKLLRESTSYFGYNPRECFEASSSAANLRAKMSEAATLISDAPGCGITELLGDARAYGSNRQSNVSHKIFQIFPTPTDTNRWLSKCQIEAVSRWALDLLLRQHKADTTAKFYYRFSTMSGTGSLRGHMFERQVLNYLRDIRTDCTFLIRGLTNSNQMPWIYRGLECITFEESTIFHQISVAVEDRKPLHLIPLARSFAAVDSILFDPNEDCLTLIQTTINRECPISVKGLQRIQACLKPDTSLEGLRSNGAKPWRVIFIVPSAMAPAFTRQKLKGDTSRGEWAGKVHQYVLGLEEKTIFRRRSDSSAITSQQGEQQVWC